MKILSNKKFEKIIDKNYDTGFRNGKCVTEQRYERTLNDITDENLKLQEKIAKLNKQIEALKKNVREAYESIITVNGVAINKVMAKPKKTTKKEVEEIDITMPTDKKRKVVKIEKEVVEPKKRGRKPNATK